MRFTARTFFAGSILAASILATSCTCKIKPEQLASLQELKRQEARLNDDIANKNKDISKIDGEIAARNEELKRCQDFNSNLKNKLSNWPNVWSDYVEPPPAPPVVTPAPEPEKTTKKKKK